MPTNLALLILAVYCAPLLAYAFGWYVAGKEAPVALWQPLLIYGIAGPVFYVVTSWVNFGPTSSLWTFCWFILASGFSGLIYERSLEIAERNGRRYKQNPGQGFVLHQATLAIAIVPSIAIVIGCKLLLRGAVAPWNKVNTVAVVILAVCLAAVLKEVWLRSKARGVSTDD